MKRTSYICNIAIAVLAATAAVSCDYKESFAYSDSERINFTTDSLYYSFGAQPFSVEHADMAVGVEIIGSPAERDRRYRIRINDELTTAVAGEHYEPLQEIHTVPAGASSTEIQVRIHRRLLDDETVYALCLELVETEDFMLGVVENQKLKICFTNRLDCPDWWNELSHWLGEYDIRKYQKFIELYGRPITSADIRESKYAILRVFKEVKLYFEEHPELGVIFPDVEWVV